MDQSNALRKLLEAADLVGMIDELLCSQASTGVSSVSVSGVRITLRNVRDYILRSHDVLAGDMVSNAKAMRGQESYQPRRTPSLEKESDGTKDGMSPLSDPNRLQMKRRDLRSSLEKVVES